MNRIIQLVKNPAIQKDILILFIFIIICIGVNLPAYLFVTKDMARLNVLSLDEWVYVDFLDTSFYPSISNGSLKELLSLRDNWGYGSLFWYSYGLFSAPFHFFSSFSSTIIALRIFSAIWLAISIFFIYKIIFLLRRNYFNAILGALGLFAMPAYYFYAKAFSAEFITLSFAIASIYFLLKDRKKINNNFYISIFFLAIAIGLKTSIAVFLPIYGCYFLYAVWKKNFSNIVAFTGKASLILIMGFFLCNPFILATKDGANHYLGLVEFNMQDNKTGHGGNAEAVTVSSWYRQGIKEDYMPLYILAICGLGFIFQLFNKNRSNFISTLFIFLLFLFNLFYIIFSVNKIWTYYLFPSFALSLIGLFTINLNDFSFFKKYYKVEKIFLIVFIVILFFINFSVIQSKYSEMINREKTPDFQNKIKAEQQFKNWLNENKVSNVKILKYPYVYFDNSLYDNIIVQPYWGHLTDWYIFQYKPDLLLIDNKIHDDMIKSPEHIYNKLISDGATIGGELFRYKIVLETSDFKVLEKY
jgi:hypothetical protein